MGLDTFAVVLDEEGESRVAPDEPFQGLELCGGMYSGGSSSSSIRGKVYNDVVAAATGQSLYERRIEPRAVADIARKLRAAVEEAKRVGTRVSEAEIGDLDLDEDGQLQMRQVEIEVLDVAGEEIKAEEAEDLARWFEICAERGYAVEGWW